MVRITDSAKSSSVIQLDTLGLFPWFNRSIVKRSLPFAICKCISKHLLSRHVQPFDVLQLSESWTKSRGGREETQRAVFWAVNWVIIQKSTESENISLLNAVGWKMRRMQQLIGIVSPATIHRTKGRSDSPKHDVKGEVTLPRYNNIINHSPRFKLGTLFLAERTDRSGTMDKLSKQEQVEMCEVLLLRYQRCVKDSLLHHVLQEADSDGVTKHCGHLFADIQNYCPTVIKVGITFNWFNSPHHKQEQLQKRE